MQWNLVARLVLWAICLPMLSVARGEATEFEAVSIRLHRRTTIDPLQPNTILAALPTKQGGPGTAHPTRIRYSRYTLLNLITEAYDLYPDQVEGPSWIRDDQFVIEALVPKETTPGELKKMLQHMINDRFKLAFRYEEAEFKVYALLVAAGGHKLTPSSIVEPSLEEDPAVGLQKLSRDVGLDANGCPVLKSARRDVLGKGKCISFVGYSTADFAKWLEKMVGNETGTNFGPRASPVHVTELTGLTGRYDFNLHYDVAYHRMAGTPGFPPELLQSGLPTSIFQAIEAQLGLTLARRTAKLRVMLVSGAQRTPTEN